MTRTGIYIFLLISSCLCIKEANAQAGESAWNLITKGDSAYASFDNALALELYQKAFEEDSSFTVRLQLSRTHYDYGLDLLAHNDKSAARSHFEQSILHAQYLVKHFSDSAQSHFMLAATMGNLAQFESGQQKVVIGRLVEKHSRKAIALDSTWAYPYVSLGLYFRELSRLGWFERTVAKVLYGRIPDISKEDVLETLLHAADIKPDFPFLHYELAMTYMLYKRNQEALDHFSILISLNPETSQDVRNQENAKRMMDTMEQNR